MALVVAYLTIGYPTPELFLRAASELRAHCDLLELGIPPRFAKYDGPVIRRSYESASTLGHEELMELASMIDAEKYALTYLDGLGGLDEYLDSARRAGFRGVLFPDLVVDFRREISRVASAVRSRGMSNAIFVSPSTPDSVAREASREADGFLYLGVRPSTGVPVPVSVPALVRRFRALHGGTLIVGFGLRRDEMAEAVRAGADGVAVGTALLEALDAGVEAAAEVLRGVRDAVGQ
ncbi:MAG: tryptophan synthase subunit alpha [Conexivisphaera sp.]